MSGPRQSPSTSKGTESSWIRDGVVVLAVLSGSSVLIALGFSAGLLYGEERSYQEQYLRERGMIEPLLASDPEFNEIRISRRSNGGVDLDGYVRSEAQRARLRDGIRHLVGDQRAEEIMIPVMVVADRNEQKR